MFSQISKQFSTFWRNLGALEKMVFVGFIVAAIALSYAFVTWASTPNYVVAFSGLSESDAGEITQQLTEDGIPYKLNGSGTIMVPSANVYEVRLRMARNGLPAGDTVGFELFSGNTFGMTEFTQRVNYQQALEGELERTIMNMNAVEAVRVHIVIPEKTLLASDQTAPTASVTLQVGSRTLDAAQVRSITHLVASSVEGLSPDSVVVVDVNGNMLASGEASGADANVAQVDSRRAAELSEASQIESKVQTILDQALGPNRSVVKAQVSMDWTERETTTQSYDPESQVVRSSQTINESYTTTGDVVGGVPGAETNLPEGVEEGADGEAGSNYQRDEEITNYEVTETQTLTIEASGEVEQVSLSVLVDGVTDATQLETLRSVIAAAAGIDDARGDVLEVQTLAFDRSYIDAQAEELASVGQEALYMQIGMAVGAGMLLLILLWYVNRLLKNLRKQSLESWTPLMLPVSQVAATQTQSTGNEMPMLLQGEPEALPQGEMPIPLEEALPELAAQMQQPLDEEQEQMQKVVARLADDDPATVAEVIQIWLDEE
ncbi:MAG: flagellar M-ring protein FliF [Chloroflexi bacterium]|nr:MAG: flagellar M-ring protein FliF [Chloroflexota bacterium]MBL1194843.1 flagellar M-ring protein FliF [Chloroflexota bacterium]NOH12134.1 flagellar M-ring protein FliF [Chloroflexota bacterium]